jgi:hypothetical protein
VGHPRGTERASLKPWTSDGHLWRQVVREHGLWASLLATHASVGWLATLSGVAPVTSRGLVHASTIGYCLKLLGSVAYLLLPLLIWARFKVRDQNGQRIPGWAGYAEALRQARPKLKSGAAGAVIAAALIVLTFATHDAWKATIGILEPYTWDPTLRLADRFLHGGVDPWRWLSWLATPTSTRWIDLAYASWYAVLATGLSWQCINPNRRQRTRFFVAFALTIVVLGTMIAHLMASGGPVFYGGLVPGDDPFADLRRQLLELHQQIPLTAVYLEQAVWENHASGARAFWIAMSAMPSIHVAMPALFGLALWTQSRMLSLAAWAYTLIIVVGSVHLGWHYALDGYVALIGTAALWQVASWAVR